MGLTLATADKVLKEDYLPGVREQLNNKVQFLAQLDKNTEDIVGKEAYIALHTQRSSGVGARGDGGSLPTANNQGYRDEHVPVRYNYGRIKISGPTIRAMRSNQGAFIRAVESEMKGIRNDMRRDINRQCFGTSDGVIATCGTTTASTTVQLAAGTTAEQMRQLEINMTVDIGTVASPTAVASARRITAQDATNKTITISGAAVTTDATNRVFREASGGSGTAQKELTGLQSIVAASGTLYGVDPTVEPSWVATVTNVGGALSEVAMSKLADDIEILSGDGINIFLGSYGVVRAYGNLLTSQKRVVNSVQLKGGWAGLEFTWGESTIPVGKDRDCPAKTLFGLNTEHIEEGVMSDYEWMEEDGAVLSRVSGEDAYEATLFRYHEVLTDQRNTNGSLTNVTES